MISVNIARGIINSTDKLARYELLKEKSKEKMANQVRQHNWLARVLLGIKY